MYSEVHTEGETLNETLGLHGKTETAKSKKLSVFVLNFYIYHYLSLHLYIFPASVSEQVESLN